MLERRYYVDNLLVHKEPFDATETVRIRLSQDKLLAQMVSELLRDICRLRVQHANQIRQLAAEHADLERLLKQQMTNSGVLTSEEIQKFNFESTNGPIRELWGAIVDELGVEASELQKMGSKASGTALQPLRNFIEGNDPQWANNRHLHRGLSQWASGDNSMPVDWERDAPLLFESFETLDMKTLNLIKSSLLEFYNTWPESFQSCKSVSDHTISKIIEFNPEIEIKRFANAAKSYNFANPSRKSSAKTNTTLDYSNQRFTSSSTVLHHDFPTKGSTNSNNDSPKSMATKKSTSKLKSKVGSLFQRNKLRGKKTPNQMDDKLPTSSTAYSVSNKHIYNDPKTSYDRVSESPYLVESNVKPNSRASSPQIPLQLKTLNKPLPMNPSNKEPIDAGFNRQQVVNARDLHIQAPKSFKSPSRNNDTEIDYFTKSQYQDKHPSPLAVQVTGELSGAKESTPQETGLVSKSSTPLKKTDTKSLESGLHASIAEVYNAKFIEGTLVEAEVMGEVALSYVSKRGHDIPIGIDLRIKDAHQRLEHKVLNKAFMEEVGKTQYKVNPQFIDSRTLGAIKYAVKNPIPPIEINPVWKFEPHQASVVLTIDMSRNLRPEVERLVVQDLQVFVVIDGAEASSALSKPAGSFSREKGRVTWRFTEPVIFKRDDPGKRLIARFLTSNQAHQSDQGISCKFVISENDQNSIGPDVEFEVKESDVDNPFGSDWQPITVRKTITSGRYQVFVSQDDQTKS